MRMELYLPLAPLSLVSRALYVFSFLARSPGIPFFPGVDCVNGIMASSRSGRFCRVSRTEVRWGISNEIKPFLYFHVKFMTENSALLSLRRCRYTVFFSFCRMFHLKLEIILEIEFHSLDLWAFVKNAYTLPD